VKSNPNPDPKSHLQVPSNTLKPKPHVNQQITKKKTVHGNPSFLPWHRYFVHVYEKALQQQCGYTGAAMYWDWTLDSGAPTRASVFDPVLGFGTNGNDTTNNNGLPRLADGAFKSLRPTYWNSDAMPHWLSRHWQSNTGGIFDLYSTGWSPAAVADADSRTTYDEFRYALENGPHSAVHFGVGGPGGDMGTQNASPNGTYLTLPYLYQRFVTDCG